MDKASINRIGWLGTGRMGTEMAIRLINGGADITVWNRTSAKCAPLVALGAKQADDISELASCDAVFVMVTTSTDLHQVTLGEGGLLRGPVRPKVIVDCSTVTAEASEKVRAEADALGVHFLAAPISGNPAMVREGGAALAVSGPRDAFEAMTEALGYIALTTVYAGPGEEARLVKLAHNLLLGMITQSLAEVTTLAEKGGITAEAFIDFINGSVLGSNFIKHKGKAIVEHSYEATFTPINLRKDYDYGLGAARELEVPMPVASLTYQLIQTLIGVGLEDLDYVVLYELQAKSAGLRASETP